MTSEQPNIYGGVGVVVYDDVTQRGIWQIADVALYPRNLADADSVVTLAWEVADEHRERGEAEGLSRKMLASYFLVQKFVYRMGTNESRDDSMMFIAYALLKVTGYEHLVVMYHKDSRAALFNRISGTHERAMKTIRERCTQQDPERFRHDANFVVDGAHRLAGISKKLH
jgi:hypothetical protein